jgi:hypothetical protein
MKIDRALLTIMISMATPAFACSFDSGVGDFRPNLKSSKRIYGRTENVSTVKPIVSEQIVSRGAGYSRGMCAGDGIVSVQVTIPKDHAFKLGDIGFYFRVVKGEDKDRIFPKHPLVGTIDGDKMLFKFIWMDDEPSSQVQLNLLVELIPVNKALELGPSTQFMLK